MKLHARARVQELVSVDDRAESVAQAGWSAARQVDDVADFDFAGGHALLVARLARGDLGAGRVLGAAESRPAATVG